MLLQRDFKKTSYDDRLVLGDAYPSTINWRCITIVIILAGMIGVGKTTYTAQLAKELGTEAFFEPVEDNPILDKYYENQLGVRKIEDSAQEEVQLLKKCGLSYLEKIILKYSRR